MSFVKHSLIFVLLTASATPAQDLPPDLLLLTRVKRHVAQERKRLSNISCLETVSRQHREPKGKMQPFDTVRLEVMVSDGKELFASPGDRKFSERPPISYAGSGSLGDGFFEGYLSKILLGNNVTYEYQGQETASRQTLARWNYRLPLMWSGQSIRSPNGSGTVSLHGSIWVDSQTEDVVRLELIAGDIPPTLPITDATWTVNFARTAVAEGAQALLPKSGDFHMTQFSGESDWNHLEFSNCRSFAAESVIRFDTPDTPEPTPSFSASSVDDTLRPLPAGLEISVKLQTPITSDLAVGSLIRGVVAVDVHAKGSGFPIPANAPVLGRIRRLEYATEPFENFVVGLEFTEVQIQGIRYRFYANIASIQHYDGVQLALTRSSNTHSETYTLPKLPGAATFFYRGSKLNLPQGFRTTWNTLTAP